VESRLKPIVENFSPHPYKLGEEPQTSPTCRQSEERSISDKQCLSSTIRALQNGTKLGGITTRGSDVTYRVVKLPVIYVGGKLPVTYRQLTGKLPVTYRPLPARMGHRTLVLKGVGQSLGLMTVIITR